ncbi:hypothetical protein [Cognatishimia maritima]|uniref:Sulfotransferase family protein n=1 Tax=Cognatishimia maritima TaxID=870908 RepID=A0A1M5IFB1_9RHOB|nr:hypothetical protein [Cognatishimia maritima]SHG26937.1 hypothetical protein SAMN04488044_0307 [Cognatishimia maritima]
MLCIHIGTGKAGSTSIQSFIKSQRANISHGQLDALEIGNSWKIAASTGTPEAKKYFVEKIKLLSEDEFLKLKQVFWAKVEAEVETSDYTNFVASSEFIYQLVQRENDILQLKRNLIRIFGEVKIILYFRNQLDYTRSVYSQMVTGTTAETQAFQKFMTERSYADFLVDYATQIKLWTDVFGFDRISATVFDRRNFSNGDLIEDFCSRAGLSLATQPASAQCRVANASPCYSELVIQRHLNMLGLHGHLPWILRKIRGAVLLLARTLAPRLPFPSDNDDGILLEISDGNAWLNERFFSDLPVQLPVENH